MGSSDPKPKVLLLGDIIQYVYPPSQPINHIIIIPAPKHYPSKQPTHHHILTRIISNSAHKTWSSLSDIADLIRPTATNRTEFIQECQSGALDGVIAAYRTFDSVKITGLVDEELVNALPKSLVYLAHCGMLTSP